MKWIFTNHAKYRFTSRWFDMNKVKETVLRPDSLDFIGGKIVSLKKFSTETIKVVYARNKNDIILITIIRL